MRVRVVRDCSHQMRPGGRMFMMRAGREFEWEFKEKPSKNFVLVEDDKVIEPSAEQVPKIGTRRIPDSPAPPILHALDRDSQIIEALNRLDHEDLDLWTEQSGRMLPRIEAVSLELEALGFDPKVTRADINVANPGFERRTT